MRTKIPSRVFVVLVIGAGIVSCGSGTNADTTPTQGIDLAFTMSGDGVASSAFDSGTGVPVTAVHFRGSELSFYFVDQETLLNGTDQEAHDQIIATKVIMELPDVAKTFSFSALGDSVTPIENVIIPPFVQSTT